MMVAAPAQKCICEHSSVDNQLCRRPEVSRNLYLDDLFVWTLFLHLQTISDPPPVRGLTQAGLAPASNACAQGCPYQIGESSSPRVRSIRCHQEVRKRRPRANVCPGASTHISPFNITSTLCTIRQWGVLRSKRGKS